MEETRKRERARKKKIGYDIPGRRSIEEVTLEGKATTFTLMFLTPR